MMRTFSALSVFFLFFLSVACQGGGSTGTGGHRFEGSVQSRLTGDVVNASVTVLETGDNTITDQQGVFAIETELLSGDVQFVVEFAETEVTVTVSNIPPEPSIIAVIFQVDDGDDQNIEPQGIVPREAPSNGDEPSIEEPSIDGPSIEEPSIDDPSIDDPSIDEPSIEEPSIDGPSIDEPSIEEPSIDEPSIQTPSPSELEN